MRTLAILACMALAALAAPPAHADTQVELLDTWPAGNAVTLQRNQNFYLHLGYTSDQPVQIWVQPLFAGKPVKAGTNTSRTYPSGNGEALGWFFLFDAGAHVDEVQVKAGDGSIDGTRVVATFPVAVTSADDAGASTTPPAWVSTLGAADKAAQDAAYQQAMDTPLTAGDVWFMRAFMLGMLALGALAIIWPLWSLWRWRGLWRVAAAIPAVAMAFVVLRIVIDGARDPTSHNLWPFEIILWGGFSCLWMLVAWLLLRLAGTKRAT